jgi:hypothetical protein
VRRRHFQALITNVETAARQYDLPAHPSALIEENKWRAVRWVDSGKLIDFGKREEARPRPDPRNAGMVPGRCAGRAGQSQEWSTPTRFWSMASADRSWPL